MANVLERELLGDRGIPVSDGAQFFLKMKKAEQQDVGLAALQGAPSPSPDTTGVMEGQFTVPVEQALALLAAMVQNEIKTMYAYMVYANSLRDLAHHSIAEEFEEHAEQELEHADFLLRRMAVLGGPVHVPDIPAPPASSDPIDILRTMLRMEQEGVQLWQQLHSITGENPTKYKIEEYMIREQEHIDELWQMIPQEARSLGEELKQASIRSAISSAVYKAKRLTGTAGVKDHAAHALRSAKKEAPGAARAVGEKAKDVAKVVVDKAPGAVRAVAKGVQGAAGKIRDAASKAPTVEEVAARMADHVIKGREKKKEIGYQIRRALGKDTFSENLARAARPAIEQAKNVAKEHPGKTLAAASTAGYLALRGNKATADGAEKKAADHLVRGSQRAEGNLAARARKHEGMRGELYGDLIGRLLAGGAGYSFAKGKGDVAQVAAAALSQHLGGKAGKLLGKEVDLRRDIRREVASQVQEKKAFDPNAAMQALELEQEAAQAQAANEAEYYREMAREQLEARKQLEQQLQAMQQELEQKQMQQEQQNQVLQQTLQGANDTVTQALTQAVASTQEAIRQRQRAADGAIMLDQLRQQLRELADGGGSPGGPGDISMQGAPADHAAAAGAVPTAVAPEGGYAPIQPNQPQGGEAMPVSEVGIKAASSEKLASVGAALLQVVKERAPYALAGAALTGGMHEAMVRGGDKVRQQLAEAEARGGEGSFRDALNIAQLRARLAFQEAREQHPTTSLALSALAGGMLGAVRGPVVADQLKSIGKNLMYLAG